MTGIEGQSSLTVVISQKTINDTLGVVQGTTIDEFRRAEYQRLANAEDPTEHLLMGAFATLIRRLGERPATSFVVGGFIVTRSLYIEAEAQAVTLLRPDPAMVNTQVRTIAEVFDPTKQIKIDDMYDEFPRQPALCEAINGLASPATRVGALTVMGVYAHHLIEPGHRMSIRIGDLSLPGYDDNAPGVTVSLAE